MFEMAYQEQRHSNLAACKFQGAQRVGNIFKGIYDAVSVIVPTMQG